MADKTSFSDAVESRRTIYALDKHLPISDDRLRSIIRDTIAYTPTAFNHQGTRIIALIGEQHDKLWEMINTIMKVQLGQETYDKTQTAKRLQQFADAYGTALIFEDPQPKKDYQGRYKRYASHFDEWQHHSSGMAQYILWAALNAEGCGCNLQHFNPVIDGPVKDAWDIDQEWRLTSQLVFGGRKEGWEQHLKEREGRYEVAERFKVL